MNSKKKKILFMVGGSKVFGAEIVSLDVMRGLKSIYDIHCAISGWNDGDFKSRLEKENIDYTAIKLGWYYLKKLSWSVDSLIHYPKAFFDYYKLLKNFNPDIIYVYSYRNLVLLNPIIPPKVIYHVEDQNANSPKHIYFIRKIDKKVIKYIACSDFIKYDLLKCGLNANKIQTVFNGIEIKNQTINIKTVSNTLKIGVVGQIIPRKGHHILIKALNLLKKEGYNFSLKIFGTGSEEYIKKLKKMITEYKLDENVEWKGYV
jgi:glycosyltransferase involved in cell wall biosynthesis